MTVKTGQALSVTFTTSDATTGSAADATGDPVGTLYKNGASTADVVTVTKPAGTGIYKAAVTLPALAAGDVVALHVAATVAGVAGAGIVYQDVADTAIASDLAASIAALNNLSSAQAQAAATAALMAFDPPTQAEMVAAIATIDTTVAISATDADTVASGRLALRTYHTFSQAITSTSTADLAGATKLWLAIKLAAADADSASVAFIEETAGLTVLAGAAYATPGHGSLVVTGLAGAWIITAAIDEAATSLLGAYANRQLEAELKALVAGSTVAVWSGMAAVSVGIVKAVV